MERDIQQKLTPLNPQLHQPNTIFDTVLPRVDDEILNPDDISMEQLDELLKDISDDDVGNMLLDLMPLLSSSLTR